ncbi:MAG: DNA-directed RNA polymerase subunit omega [bacterium]|jgi:DNA-directed RNA polymerase subunit omega
MIEPGYDELLQRVDSKYTLVVVAAKRARQLMDGAPLLVSGIADNKLSKPVSLALQEVAAGKIQYERLKSGIK